MPRAFLITSRRYNGSGEFEETEGEFSPEHGVRLAEYNCISGQQSTSDGASECASEESSSECPEELYNLTKLAEVSLAAAAGTLVHPRHYQPNYEPERSRLFFERIESERESLIELKTRTIEREDELLESARLASENRFVDGFKPEDVVLPPTPPSTTPTTPTRDNGSRQQSDDIVSPSPVPLPQQSPAQRNNEPQQETGEEHECPDCGKRYSTSSNLARHRQTHRSLGDKKARRCPHCDKVYVSIPAFSMHVRTHNQGCKCHFCGKCFSRPWLLQGHIRTHTGEKPFKCTICNKAFADKSNLRAHIQTHSNTKPHVCGRCGKAFALKSYLYKHEESSCMRSHHQQQQKRESSSSPRLSTPSASPSTVNTQTTGSPTSVIVPPRNLHSSWTESSHASSAFSTIIQHTRSRSEHAEQDCATRKEDPNVPSKDLLSRMVIRTSVISPNPEHVARFAEKKVMQQQTQQQQQSQPFDFNDPTRVSAFSRPQPMTLNLAIA